MATCAWSAENATKAFLHTLKMGKRGKEPNVAEFIAAFAAGNSAQLMVMACAGSAGSHSRFRSFSISNRWPSSVYFMRAQRVASFKKGPRTIYAHSLLLHDYQDADFVLIDCKMGGHKQLLQAAQRGLLHKDALLVEYNTIHSDSWMALISKLISSPLEKAYWLLE